MKNYISGKNGLRVNVPDGTVSCNGLCLKVDVPAGPVGQNQPSMRFDPPNNGMIAETEGRLLIRSPVAYPSGAVLTVTPSERWPFSEYEPVSYSFADANANPVSLTFFVEDFTPTGAITISNIPAGVVSVAISGEVRLNEVEETYCVTLTAPEGFGNGLSDCTTVLSDLNNL